MSSGSLCFKPLEDLAVLGPESYVDILGAPGYMVLAVGWPRVEFHPTIHCAPCYLIPGLSLWCVKSKRPPCRSSLPPASQLLKHWFEAGGSNVTKGHVGCSCSSCAFPRAWEWCSHLLSLVTWVTSFQRSSSCSHEVSAAHTGMWGVEGRSREPSPNLGWETGVGHIPGGHGTVFLLFSV